MNDKTTKQEETLGNEKSRPFGKNSGTTGLHKGASIDWQTEFKEGISKGLFYEKMAQVAMAYVSFMNPVEILAEVKELDDKLQEQIKEILQGFMMEYLEMRLNVMKCGKTLPEHIIGLATDMVKRETKRYQE